MSLTQIAAVLNGRGVPTARQTSDDTKALYWRASAVWRMLENPMYKGLYSVNFGRSKDDERRLAQRVMPELALVSEYDWQVVQGMGKRSPPSFEVDVVQGKKAMRGAYGGSKHPFAGVFRCGTCGVSLSCHHPRTPGANMHCIQCARATGVGVPGRQPLYLSVKSLQVLVRFLLDKVLSPDVMAVYRTQLKERLVGGREAELKEAESDLAKAERSQARLARLLGQIENDDAMLEAQYAKTRVDVLELQAQVDRLKVSLTAMNKEAIQRQLALDTSTVVDAFLSGKHAPERTSAILKRIFPAIVLRGKVNRYTSLFEVHVKPGAILAEASDTPVLVDKLEVMWVRLNNASSKNPVWSAEVIEPPVGVADCK